MRKRMISGILAAFVLFAAVHTDYAYAGELMTEAWEQGAEQAEEFEITEAFETEALEAAKEKAGGSGTIDPDGDVSVSEKIELDEPEMGNLNMKETDIEETDIEETDIEETDIEETVIEDTDMKETGNTSGDYISEEITAEELESEINTDSETEMETEDSEFPVENLAEELQKEIDALPDTAAYDRLSLTGKEAMDQHVDELKEDYFEGITDEEREEVDMTHLAALDLYGDTLTYLTEDQEAGKDHHLKSRSVQRLSGKEMEKLNDRIDDLPELHEIVNVAAILTNPETGEESGRVLAYSNAKERVYLSESEMDALYREVYEAANLYFSLPDDQADQIHRADKIMNLTGFFSVGMRAYPPVEIAEAVSQKAEGSNFLLQLADAVIDFFSEDVQAAATTTCGKISDYEHLTYSGSMSTHHWICGYYKVSTPHTDSRSTIAFCTNSKQKSPGQTGTVFTTESQGSSNVIKALLYYGYGGPEQLSTIKNDRNGYIETHYAISWATRGASGTVIDDFAEACYNKIYGKLTAQQKEKAAKMTTYYLVGTGVSGTQKLAYAVYNASICLKKKGEPSGNPIAGAQYRVYADEACTSLRPDMSGSYTFTTGEDGIANELYYPKGSVIYVKESFAPENVLLDETVYKVTVGAQTWVHPQEWNTDLEAEKPAEITMTLQKLDSEIKNALSQVEDRDLSGAIFALEYFSDPTSAEACEQTWRYVTDADGRIHFADSSYLEEEGEVPAFAPGLYKVKEVSAPAYYGTEGTMFFEEQKASPEEGVEILIPEGGFSEAKELLVTCEDVIRRNRITLTKKGGDRKPLSGVTFILYDSSENPIATQTSGNDGNLCFEDLLPGTYTLMETETADGHSLLEKPITVTLPIAMTEEEAMESHGDLTKAVVDEVLQKYLFCEAHFDVSNSPDFAVPKAGGRGLQWTQMTIGMLLLLLGCISLRNLRKAL